MTDYNQPMKNPTPQLVRLADYRPPAFLVSQVNLVFDLLETHTEVTATLRLARNTDPAAPGGPLELAGDGLELLSVRLDGAAMDPAHYAVTPALLTLKSLPDSCVLETRVRLNPERNTQFMGLYASRDGYFTQCEAEGFRRITYFLDRPDVMARYTTTIRADATRFPILLSNGNRVDGGQLPEGRHWARWEDPFPKPAYLFALVAGRLDLLEESFVTRSGRTVRLQIYVEPGRVDQCGFALEALKASMRWDEETYGLEVDLDQYMIVAVSDFNMGAMENKGLNIFNTKYVLARPELATDFDFMMLDRVVAHEYFHNWTGNRVTCRDWFQLSLKEGLTVFRDQQYGEDRYSRAVQRIQEVRSLRAGQFPEDAGPMAHPVRPAAYMEISNFYTATVYNKGAEVVRMMHTLLGTQGFRRGMDLYFARHDGQAVCTEDFVAAMQAASGMDLSLMQRWYEQSGTPYVAVHGEYHPAAREFHLHFRQRCALGPGETHKLPFPIPIALGLLSPTGEQIPIVSDDASVRRLSEVVFLLTEETQSLILREVDTTPVPSLLRGFSAPVVLEYPYTEEELALLMAHDSDAFNRWEAGQRLATDVLMRAVATLEAGDTPRFPASFLSACGRLLSEGRHQDPGFAAEALTLPGAAVLAEHLVSRGLVINPEAILRARNALRRCIAETLRADLSATWGALHDPAWSPSPEAAARRALRNVCLAYLMELETAEVRQQCLAQFELADNMTDQSAALSALAQCDCPERRTALDAFQSRFRDEPLVLDKWFAIQAGSRLPGTLCEVKALLDHPAFEISNPNKVRALIGTFCHANHAGFHAGDGSGYAFAADQIIAIDPLNPQVAARLARAFDRWKQFDAGRQAHARRALERIRSTPELSRDTTEIVTRALA